MIADKEQTEDEWREGKFRPEQLISARLNGSSTVTLKQLKGALDKYGPDSILETGVLLPRAEYEELERLVRKAPKPITQRRRRR